jgi:predicted Zn-dependent protease
MWLAGRCVCPAAALLVTAACTTPSVDGTAPPYDPTALTGGVIYHWPAGAGLAIHVVPEPAADEALRTTVGSAAARWAGALGYREHTLRLIDEPSAADIIVRDARTPSPVETIACGGPGWTEAAASTFFCPAGDTARTLVLVSGPAGRVKVLVTVDVASIAGDGALMAVVLHELGHALGIGGHSSVSTDAMFASPAVAFPSSRDARTLRYLLHRRPDLTL